MPKTSPVVRSRNTDGYEEVREEIVEYHIVRISGKEKSTNKREQEKKYETIARRRP